MPSLIPRIFTVVPTADLILPASGWTEWPEARITQDFTDGILILFATLGFDWGIGNATNFDFWFVRGGRLLLTAGAFPTHSAQPNNHDTIVPLYHILDSLPGRHTYSIAARARTGGISIFGDESSRFTIIEVARAV